MTTPRFTTNRLLAIAVALCAADGLSCFASPETCHLCTENAPGTGGDGGGGTDPGSSGGTPGGTGGGLGDAGRPGSGGAGALAGSSGMAGKGGGGESGATASGGSSSGGAPGTGGAATGGQGGAGAAGGAIGTTGSGGTIGAGSGGAGGRGSSGTGGGSGGVASSGGAMGGSGVASGGMGGSGSGGAGGRGGAGGGGATIDPDLVLWYKFDESSGTSAADSAMFGGTARNGTLTNVGTGSASFSTTAKVGSHSVSLTGSSSTAGGYVSFASLSTVAPSALTIACWMYLTADRNWQRLFDFGKVPSSGQPSTYMFLTTHQGVTSPGSMRFAISTGGTNSEQVINMSTPAVPSLNAWHHVAVTLGAGATYTGTLYIDKAVAGTNTGMSLHWSDLGATDQNTFGRSQFSADPYFAGMLDDCRVYRRALTAAEITALP